MNTVQLYCMTLAMRDVVSRLLAYTALSFPKDKREALFREFMEDTDQRIRETTETVVDEDTTEEDLIDLQEGIRFHVEALISLARVMISDRN